jgi:hypothetical protein
MLVQEVGEVSEVDRRLAQVGAQPTAKGDILLDRIAHGAHRAPRAVGHGMATFRRASKSSLA